uniref:Tail protein n=1 Tax=viral metagenome TaxID=1070528 RepID=A0A6M3K561_9ZZZZ
MFHSSYLRPRIYSYNGDVAPAQIDRLQSLSSSPTLNREEIREIGRDGIVDWRKRIPSNRVTAMQYEYGDLEFFRKITNKADSVNTITLADFKSSMFDIGCYKTDDDGTFISTTVYPKLRVAGFSINIGDPQAYIERNFDFIGEDEDIYEGSNKYYIYKKFTASGGAPESFTVSSPTAVLDPDNSGQYMIRVLRVNVSDGTTDELTYTSGTASGTNFAFSAPSTLTVATSAGDVVKAYYTATTYLSSDVFTNNDTDAAALPAENCSILLYVSADNIVYKLQSVGIDVSFDRTDYYEIGSDKVIQRGVRSNTVRFTLGKILDAYTIEEIMRGVSSTYGRINTRKYIDNATFRLKIYGNSTKNTFNIGFKSTNLSPVDLGTTVPTNDYVQRIVTMQSDNLQISTTESVIDA